ncbi:hypothetical protein F4823DRAFT_582267 [Ustulina deusta]|nr:hypothetical protein F4823DRAFT_582267 [Ustulina deusta]
MTFKADTRRCCEMAGRGVLVAWLLTIMTTYRTWCARRPLNRDILNRHLSEIAGGSQRADLSLEVILVSPQSSCRVTSCP